MGRIMQNHLQLLWRHCRNHNQTLRRWRALRRARLALFLPACLRSSFADLTPSSRSSSAICSTFLKQFWEQVACGFSVSERRVAQQTRVALPLPLEAHHSLLPTQTRPRPPGCLHPVLTVSLHEGQLPNRTTRRAQAECPTMTSPPSLAIAATSRGNDSDHMRQCSQCMQGSD